MKQTTNEEILEILKNVMYWDVCPIEYKNKIKTFLKEYKAGALSISDVTCCKFFSVESGGDWADASVDYFINLTDRTGEDVYNEYYESGGYHGNGQKRFKEWAIEKGYMREPTDSELEIFYDD